MSARFARSERTTGRGIKSGKIAVEGVEGRMSKEGIEVVIGERGERLAAASSRRCGRVERGSGQRSRCARGRGRCGQAGERASGHGIERVEWGEQKGGGSV